MATSEGPSQPSVRRPRKRHQKSRNGCFECKRRRVKCDEIKPKCMRCVLLLNKCIYASTPQSAAKYQRDELCPPDSSCTIPSISLSTPSRPDRSSSSEISTGSTPEFAETNHSRPNSVDSDSNLYNHYVQHTSRTLIHSRKDQSALQFGMPLLALQSKTVFHSLLAVSATCLCYDMISKDDPPDVTVVNKVLMSGYRHYNLAIERMRESLSSSDSLKLDPLLASALALMPFAAASQQINHWISRRSEVQESLRFLSSTPRDIIIIIRGIRTTLQALDGSSPGPYLEKISLEPEFGSSNSLSSPEARAVPAALTASSTHPMAPILATTIQKAFSELQKRLECAFLYKSEDSDNFLSPCGGAFEILKDIRNNTFFSSKFSSPSSSNDVPVEEFSDSKPISLQQVTSWLRSFASRSVVPVPSEPLTRCFLTFLVQVPQAYLEIVLPLLDQRLESPIGTSSKKIASELTTEQALALDIYAHWSVLMFLAEEEAWWIGKLPVVTLSGMVNRYGDDFVSRLQLEKGNSNGKEEPWWPGSMLNILREVKRYQE